MNQKQINETSISREVFLKELKLREVIRKIISISENKQKQKENILRTVIRNLIAEGEADKTPHASTAINFLEDLLKKILPSIEQDYKSLTTKKEQRDSFRSQLVSSVETLLDTANVNAAAGGGMDSEEEFIDIEEEIEINVADDEKFIDIDGEDAAIEEPDEEAAEEQEASDTGAKLAAQSFDAIEKQTLESYNTLSDQEDQKTFKDYMITNLKLYFDKWEKELGEVIEPTTDEYEEEKETSDSEETGEELGGEDEFGTEEEVDEEEFEL